MTITAKPTNTHLPADAYSFVKARHPWRWISAAIIVSLGLLLLRSVVSNPNFGWDTVGMYIRDASIVRGIGITLELTAICMLIGIVLGVVLAVMRISANPVVRTASFANVSFFRGTPVLVQLLFWYNLAALYPSITFGIPGVDLDANEIITPMFAAILGLGLNQAAYMSEIVRAGILSVEHGQSEAAGALGINRLQTMRRIFLPHAIRVIIPPTGNETIGMLKTTALVSVISVPELLYSAQIIYARSFETIPLLMVASIWYIVVTSVLSVGQYYLERHYAKGGQRSLPLTPRQQLRRFVRVHDPLTIKGAKNECDNHGHRGHQPGADDQGRFDPQELRKPGDPQGD